MKQSPKISIVVTSRNDDHGGDAMKRMNIFMRGLIAQTNKFQLPCELIFVEWNPPKNKPLLHEVLPQPVDTDFLTSKFIVVPEEIHKKLAFNELLFLYQMIAKNVGIRRASADFILCTNIDLLFSDELIIKLKDTHLEKNAFYRANRCDIPADINGDLEVDELLTFCKKNILKVNGLNPDKQFDPYEYSNSFIFKYSVFAPVAKYYRNQFFKRPIHPYHQIKMLDLDACGDFTLMHKTAWEKINGYYELEMYSLHIDSIAIIAAHAIGLKQVVWPANACTYHISHTGGWEEFNPLAKLRFYEKRPVLDWLAVAELGEEMIRRKEALTINKNTWGLNTEKFDTFQYP